MPTAQNDGMTPEPRPADTPSTPDRSPPDYADLLRIGLVSGSVSVFAASGTYVEHWLTQRQGLRALALHTIAMPLGLIVFHALRRLGVRVLLAGALLVLAPSKLPGAVLLGVGLACHGGLVVPGLAAGLAGAAAVVAALVLKDAYLPSPYFRPVTPPFPDAVRLGVVAAVIAWATATIGRRWLLAEAPLRSPGGSIPCACWSMWESLWPSLSW